MPVFVCNSSTRDRVVYTAELPCLTALEARSSNTSSIGFSWGLCRRDVFQATLLGLQVGAFLFTWHPSYKHVSVSKCPLFIRTPAMCTWAHSIHLILIKLPLKTLPSKKITFWGTGVRTRHRNRGMGDTIQPITCFFFFLFTAVPAACGSSQARRWIGTAAEVLYHSHSNTGSKPHLQPSPQLAATLDP